MGERRCVRIGGGAESSSLEGEGDGRGCGAEVEGCLELTRQKLKKLR